jgi:AP-3 complex subunit beta
MQVFVLEMMQKYVRDQFLEPRKELSSGPRALVKEEQADPGSLSAQLARGFYSDDDSYPDSKAKKWSSSAGSPSRQLEDSYSGRISRPAEPEKGSVFTGKEVSIEYDDSLDPDHRLVLSSSLALLKSRNSAVVLAVCALHFYCGVVQPTSPTSARIAKAMVRILRNRREIQFAVLTSVKSMVLDASWLFSNYVQEFYVKSTDPLFNRYSCLCVLNQPMYYYVTVIQDSEVGYFDVTMLEGKFNFDLPRASDVCEG